MTILSSLVAPHIVFTTACSDTINYNDGILTTLSNEMELTIPVNNLAKLINRFPISGNNFDFLLSENLYQQL